MRLTGDELNILINVLNQYINEPAELRLFGSRIDDEARGGDIDLLILVTFDDTASNLMYLKSKILSEIKSVIGDQKIDLLITTFMKQDLFIQSVLPDSIVLHYFK